MELKSVPVETEPMSSHPYVGRQVSVRYHGNEIAAGVVTRVVKSRYGLLAQLDGKIEKAYRLIHCEEVFEDSAT